MLTSKSVAVKDENNGKTYVIARFITAHKKSCRKVMFSGFCLSGEGEGGRDCLSWRVSCQGDPPYGEERAIRILVECFLV